MSARRPPPTCAICGADIPPKARACPACGADERNGWDEQSLYDGLDLPEGYSEEPSRPTHRRQRWRNSLIATIALIVLIIWILHSI